MSFKRTNRGISNQHLFHNVDLIVFVEGGLSYTKDEVNEGKYNNESIDSVFWKKLFHKYANTKKVKFKAVGSKSTIKEIALDIVNGNITSVMIAMDSEFDELLALKIDHPDVLYTHGYSWENDVWNDQVVHKIIRELSAIEIDANDIELNFKTFLKKIRVGVFADAYLFSKDDSYFPRKGYMCCVNCTPADLPSVKSEIINDLLDDKGLKRTTINGYGRKKNIDVKRFCYGHLLSDYCYHLIANYLRNRMSLTGITKAFIYRMGINKFFDHHLDNTEYDIYYRKQFNKNGAQQQWLLHN